MIGYFAGMNYFYGGTLGKRYFGLRVALPASRDVAVKLVFRALVKIVCLAPPLFFVYALTAIWRPDGRSLADLVAGSTVVEVKSLQPPAQPGVVQRVLASLLTLFSPFLFLLLLLLGLIGWMVQEFVREFLLELFSEL